MKTTTENYVTICDRDGFIEALFYGPNAAQEAREYVASQRD